MLASGHAFDLSAKSNAHFFVSNFFTDPVLEYTQSILQSTPVDLSLLNIDVTLTHTGSQLLRSVARAWSLLNSDLPRSRIAEVEVEDELMANFVAYASDNVQEQNATENRTSHRVSRVEEFIYSNLSNPITREQLARVSATSIRTISRGFVKKHGIPPMAFIKARRMDAAYLDLLGAEPDTTTVTQVAINYGFAHVGKFAIEYRKTFGESPSASLARR